MCLWQPDQESWTVRQDNEGVWQADWQDADPIDPPPSSIGWLTWHITWWWRNALVAVRGERPDPVRGPWAGSAERVVSELRELADQWTAATAKLNDATLAAPCGYPWPDPRPLMYTIAWVNLELMKNVAEIGQVANMYANRNNG
jgi:hypothetical protein